MKQRHDVSKPMLNSRNCKDVHLHGHKGAAAAPPGSRSMHAAHDIVQSRKRRRAGLAGALRSTLGAAGAAAAPPWPLRAPVPDGAGWDALLACWPPSARVRVDAGPALQRMAWPAGGPAALSAARPALARASACSTKYENTAPRAHTAFYGVRRGS